jgi:chromosome segregation ATPase
MNELRLRLQSANRELEERAVYQESEWKARLQSVTRELEEEMTRCAVITKDKNAMADKMEDYISKMEKMQRHNRELEREKRELLMMNRELEAKNTMIDLLSTEKHALDDAMDGSLAQIAELQKRNAELEKETTMLKEELIDVLEVASHYQ